MVSLPIMKRPLRLSTTSLRRLSRTRLQTSTIFTFPRSQSPTFPHSSIPFVIESNLKKWKHCANTGSCSTCPDSPAKACLLHTLTRPAANSLTSSFKKANPKPPVTESLVDRNLKRWKHCSSFSSCSQCQSNEICMSHGCATTASGSGSGSSSGSGSMARSSLNMGWRSSIRSFSSSAKFRTAIQSQDQSGTSGMDMINEEGGGVSSSTALLHRVKEREELESHRDGERKEIGVIDGGIGSEGGRSAEFSLADESTTGNWTISHPIYTREELDAVKVIHRPAEGFSDWLARSAVKTARWSYDLATFYKHKTIPSSLTTPTPSQDGSTSLTVQQLRDGGYIFTPEQWLSRILFLESIAGVPGMVGGVLRHLRSLRLMRRDGGWIHTLLTEAENERMHLLTFMTVKQPSPIFRAFVLAAQGVFFNMFFLAYLLSPRTAHRFVGYLEEEACLTYTRCLSDMEKGWVPEWEDVQAPEIAIDYWRLAPDAKLIDVIYAVRADEAGHRMVNHTLANLDQKRDFNPFALREPDAVTIGQNVEFSREEAADFARRTQEEVMLGGRQAVKQLAQMSQDAKEEGRNL